MCPTIKILISNWPRKLKFSQSSVYRQERHASCFWLFSTRSSVGHALRPIFMLWLVKIWQVKKIYAECILRLVHFDSWSWQSFVWTYDVFNCLLPLSVQSEIQLLSRVFCYSWLICLLGFWLRNRGCATNQSASFVKWFSCLEKAVFRGTSGEIFSLFQACVSNVDTIPTWKVFVTLYLDSSCITCKYFAFLSACDKFELLGHVPAAMMIWL